MFACSLRPLPGVRPSKALSSFTALSVGFGLSPIPRAAKPLGDEARDPLGSQEHAQFTAHSGKFVLGAPPTRR